MDEAETFQVKKLQLKSGDPGDAGGGGGEFSTHEPCVNLLSVST